jgi:hypothetical protein
MDRRAFIGRLALGTLAGTRAARARRGVRGRVE